MKKISIKSIAALLCAILMLTACGQANAPAASQNAAAPQETAQTPSTAQEQAGAADTGELYGKPWINSNLIGNLPKEAPDLKDDFHLAVNYDWLTTAKLPEGETSFSTTGELTQLREEQLMSILTDQSKDAASQTKEEQIVHALYNVMADMDARNKAGIEPIKKYMENIAAVKDIGGLTALLTDRKALLGNPFAISGVTIDQEDSTAYVVSVFNPGFTLNDADLYKDVFTGQAQKDAESYDAFFKKALKRFGYTDGEIDAINKAAWDLEKRIALKSKGNAQMLNPAARSEQYNPYTFEELKAEAGNFPIADILKADGYGGGIKYILGDPEWLAELGKLYAEENLEGFKAILLRGTVQAAADSLDQEFLDMYYELTTALNGAPSKISAEKAAYQAVSSAFGDALGKLFIEKYFDEKTKADVENMIGQMIAVYRKRLQAADWLSDETRAKAVEKLDNLGVYVGYTDVWIDYTDLQLPSSGEGAGVLDYIIAINEFNHARELAKLGKPVEKEGWGSIGINTYVVNAFYNPQDNSINIPAGILGGVFYDPDGTKEQNMGAIGTAIGHEISHAFDTGGSQYDKDGNMKNWWTEEDRAAFKERTDKVSQYYGNMEMLDGMFVNGDTTIGETVADLGGMACMLEMAKEDPNFDYDAFFKSHAITWACIMPAEVVEYLLRNDTHAPDNLRTNITLQQFSEFYETYGIKEGDGMYLAPEKRLAVW